MIVRQSARRHRHATTRQSALPRALAPRVSGHPHARGAQRASTRKVGTILEKRGGSIARGSADPGTGGLLGPAARVSLPA